jgi:hypothetical protein
VFKQVNKVLVDRGIQDKVVAFVTDWGSNMVAAGTALSGMLKNYVTSVGCLQHLLNNTLKDFAKAPSISSCFDRVKKVVKSSPATAPLAPSMTPSRSSSRAQR